MSKLVKNTLPSLSVVVLALLIFMAAAAYVSSHPEDSYKATVSRVVDGDTVDLKILIWPDLFYFQRVRIIGIDTPELRASRECEKQDARIASELVKEWIPVGNPVSVKISGMGKYGRPLGVVTTADGRDVGASLVAAGLALPYWGGKKKEWKCVSL